MNLELLSFTDPQSWFIFNRDRFIEENEVPNLEAGNSKPEYVWN